MYGKYTFLTGKKLKNKKSLPHTQKKKKNLPTAIIENSLLQKTKNQSLSIFTMELILWVRQVGFDASKMLLADNNFDR